jgi:hypothetical protein
MLMLTLTPTTSPIITNISTISEVFFNPLSWFCIIGSVLIFIITLGIIIYAFKKQKKMTPILIYAMVTDIIIISSLYGIMGVGHTKSLWSIFDISSFLFLSIFFKVLLAFLIYVLIRLMTHPENLTEFVAKIFGIELSFKQQVNNALENFENAKKQITYISAINEATVELISSKFEDQILDSEKIGEEIRRVVKDILLSVYNSSSNVVVYVISLSDQAISNLEEHLAALVRINCQKDIDICTVYDDRIGIGVYRGNLEDDETVIILDATKADYIFTDGEITAASNLYLSVSTIITWAQDYRDMRTLIVRDLMPQIEGS